MEGSDFAQGAQNNESRATRVPNIGDKVLARPNSEYREAEVIALAADKYGTRDRVKVRYKRWFGMCEDWVWAFDLHYLATGTTVAGQGPDQVNVREQNT